MSSGFEGVLDSSVLRFAEALSGGRGALDAWLEVNNEADVRLHVEAYAEKRSRQLAEQRAELLEALRKAESRLRRLSEFDCVCRPCHGSCRTGRGAEIELEGRMETAAEYADETLKDIANATQQRNATGGEG